MGKKKIFQKMYRIHGLQRAGSVAEVVDGCMANGRGTSIHDRL